jgi:hypothetical protein
VNATPTRDPSRPWRPQCPWCGGSGRREPTGETHRAPGLIDCEMCDPLPPPAETLRVVSEENP